MSVSLSVLSAAVSPSIASSWVEKKNSYLQEGRASPFINLHRDT